MHRRNAILVVGDSNGVRIPTSRDRTGHTSCMLAPASPLHAGEGHVRYRENERQEVVQLDTFPPIPSRLTNRKHLLLPQDGIGMVKIDSFVIASVFPSDIGKEEDRGSVPFERYASDRSSLFVANRATHPLPFLVHVCAWFRLESTGTIRILSLACVRICSVSNAHLSTSQRASIFEVGFEREKVVRIACSKSIASIGASRIPYATRQEEKRSPLSRGSG